MHCQRLDTPSLRRARASSAALAVPAALAALAAVATLGACVDERPIAWERDRAVLGPVPLKDRVVYVDSARDRAIAVDVSEPAAPRVHTFPIGRQAIFITPTPDREHVAVITRGEEALVEGQIDESPQLWLVDVATPDSTPVAYALGSPFDRLTISADGSVAVAYFSTGGPDAGGYFRNPNELAVIQLTEPPGPANPVLKTVRSFGAAPDGVLLSPPMVIPGAEDPSPRVLAFVLAPNNLTVLDTAHPERREVSIRLDVGGTATRPREIAFAPATATAYVRSDQARDVLEVRILPETPAEGDALDNDYRPALAELGAGAGPADIAVYDDIGGRRLVLAATPGTSELVVIDADTAELATVSVPDPVDRILLFPDDPAQVPRIAVLASIGSRLPRVHVLQLEGITDELVGAELATVSLDEPVLDLVPVPGREMGMVVHDDERTVLGLLDLAFNAVSPLQGVGRLDDYDFSPDGGFLIGATAGVSRVGFLQLDTLHPSSLRLDDAPSRVFALPGGPVYIDHGDPMGRVTILPDPEAARDEARVLAGFLLADIFDERF